MRRRTARGRAPRAPMARLPPRGSRAGHAQSVITCARPNGTVLVDVRAGRRVSLGVFGTRVWNQLVLEPTVGALVSRLHADRSSAERLGELVVRLRSAWPRRGKIEWRG